MQDSDSALCLLQSAHSSGLQFDANLKNLVMAHLARTSPKGLKAALVLHAHMKRARDRMNAQGYLGLLEGICAHGMLPLDNPIYDYYGYEKLRSYLKVATKYDLIFMSSIHVKYVDDESELDDDLEAQEPIFMLTPSCGLTLARKLYEEVVGQGSHMRDTMNACFLRCVFRSHHEQVVDKDDMKFKLSQLHEAFKRVLDVMQEYKIRWSYAVGHALLDESLAQGYKWGVNIVVQAMWQNALWARTDTFNVLLAKYATNGKGEMANRVLKKKMGLNNTTAPDIVSYARVMEACVKGKGGRLLVPGVFKRIIELRDELGVEVPKRVWELNVALQIYNNADFSAALQLMSREGAQPDESTVLEIISTYLEQDRWEEVLKLYTLLQEGEQWRKTLKHQAMGKEAFFESSDASTENAIARLLPPPTRVICNVILEECRIRADWRQALATLQGMIERYCEQQALDSVTDTSNPKPTLTSSGALLQKALFGPDVHSFELVLEACVEANQTVAAQTLFQQMKNLGYKGGVHVYTSMIRVFGRMGDVSSAMSMFREMRSK
jgi:pentatricopeptide repeat protein